MNLQQVHTRSSEVITDAEALKGSTTTSAEATTPSLLPSPDDTMLDGDMGAEIAALAVKTGQAQRDLASKATETEDAIQDRAEQSEVSTMHDEATTMRDGAWASGLAQIGAGVCSVAAGCASIGATAKNSNAAIAAVLKGGADGLNGGGTLAGGLSKAAATDTEALATAQKALADAAERSGATDRDAQKSASDFVQSAIEFYREYQTTKAQAQGAAVHGA